MKKENDKHKNVKSQVLKKKTKKYSIVEKVKMFDIIVREIIKIFEVFGISVWWRGKINSFGF